jgi:hypothetical protein
MIEQLCFHGEQHTVLPVNDDGNRVVHPAGELQRPCVGRFPIHHHGSGGQYSESERNGAKRTDYRNLDLVRSNRLQRERRLHDDTGRLAREQSRHPYNKVRDEGLEQQEPLQSDDPVESLHGSGGQRLSA